MTQKKTRFARARDRVELGFERLTDRIAARPWLVIGVCAVFMALLAPHARYVVFDTSPEEFLNRGHPVRETYTEFKQQFGSDSFILVTVRSDEIFAPDFLAWLRELHDAFEDRVPYVEEVTSLANVRSTYGKDDELVVEDLLEDWPLDSNALEELEARVMATPFYQRLIIGDDGRHTSISIELLGYTGNGVDGAELAGFSDDSETNHAEPSSSSNAANQLVSLTSSQEEEAVGEIYAVIDDFERPGVEFYVAGTAATNIRILQDIGTNFVVFLVLSTIAMTAVLTFLFRRASGVLLPLLVVMSALAGTFGFVGARGMSVNMTAQILPSFLMAVGSSSAIHLLVIFYQHYDGGAARSDALKAAMRHSGAPVAMACITTAVGLGSFSASNLVPVQDLGLLAPVGIAIGLVFSLTLLPALLCVVPLARRVPCEPGDATRLTRGVAYLGEVGVNRPWTVLSATGLLVVTSLFGIRMIGFEHNALEWFPASDPIHTNTRVSDLTMGGSSVVEVVIDTGIENGLYEPEFQKRLEAFEEHVLTLGETDAGGAREVVRKTVSLNGVLKEIHQALNANQPEFYAVPDDRTLIAQEFLLFENSGADDLEELVDSKFSVARVSLRCIWEGASFYEPFLEMLEVEAKKAFPEETVRLTGMLPIIMTSLVETQEGMIKSYILALLAITPLMMVLVGTLRGGLASMVPNLAPFALVLGLMGWMGIKLDSFTMLTGSVAIGLAVDDTIHFFHSFYREFGETGDTRQSVRNTLLTTGEALLTTSIVLSLGFGVFLFATMPTLRIFGGITALAIVLAFIADVLVAPALVTLATRNRQAPGVGSP